MTRRYDLYDKQAPGAAAGILVAAADGGLGRECRGYHPLYAV